MTETAYLKAGKYRENTRQAAGDLWRLSLGAFMPTNRLLSGVVACALAIAVVAPVSLDTQTGYLSLNAAYAGSGDGNYGKGRGNGGPNGENPGNGGGNGKGGGDGDGGGDGGDGGDGDGGDGDGDRTPARIPPTDSAGGGAGTDEAAEIADENFGEAVEAVAGTNAEGPMGNAAATGLPTVTELFSLGDEATVSAEEELQLIANGWKSGN